MPTLTLLHLETQVRRCIEASYSARRTMRTLTRLYPAERFNCLDVNLYVWNRRDGWFCIGYCDAF